MDYDSAGLKQKVVLSVISLCLGNKEDFRADVIKEALSDLLLDPVPPQALMRTAILSAQVNSTHKHTHTHGHTHLHIYTHTQTHTNTHTHAHTHSKRDTDKHTHTHTHTTDSYFP